MNRCRRRFLHATGLGLIGAALPSRAKPKRPKHRLRGLCSWYGKGFQGKKTASGERFDRHKMTAAHRTLPFGTLVKVTTLGKKPRSVVVRINDRGPFKKARVIDVSEAAAKKLGLIKAGMAEVRVDVLPPRK